MTFEIKEPKRVGVLHGHRLPGVLSVQENEVYRCYCGKEFFARKPAGSNTPEWEALEASPHYVAYDVHDDGEPEIGRWTLTNPAVEAKEEEARVEHKEVEATAEEVKEGAVAEATAEETNAEEGNTDES